MIKVISCLKGALRWIYDLLGTITGGDSIEAVKDGGIYRPF
jgi:hypothetical protein